VTPTERRQRITEVCELARQLRPEDRDVFVEGQCLGDGQLLQDVKSALPEYLQTGEVTGVFPGASEGPPAPPPIQRVGRYEITGNIGSGGSGHVYSALDRTVGRVVAIKMLNAPGDADLVRRFRAEAKTVANLHHKNIVTVHEYGEEDGIPYLVMEYLNGTTLQELIRQRSLSLLEMLEIMTEVAEGLHYAHEHGVTHRDVKPANIMRLTGGSVKIMDFGIARLGAQSATQLTQSGLLIGSLMYMAPEQFNGTADALTDVFGYGVTFYELLTGKNPFASPDPVVIIFKISNTDPPPVRSAAPECPEALDRIVCRTMARDREARYSSLSDVLADTRGILSDLRRDQAYKSYTEAEQLFAGGQLDAAKSAVRKALELDPAQEEARNLRSEIEEALRRRDAAVRAQSLMDQAEKAVQEQRWEEAGGILDSIRELGVVNPQLQGRLDWAAAQVEKARRRERLLDEARRDLRNDNLTEAFRAVSEVLASDPGNGPGKDLLQEVRNQMATSEARRRLREEAARAEGLLLIGETDQAIFILAELERRNPEFAEAALLRARAEDQKEREKRAQRLAEATAEVNDLLKNGLFEMAVTRIDELAIDFPDDESLQALRVQASESPATRRVERIAKLKSEAEELIARREFDQAVQLLETAVAVMGDDWDLTRLLLQAVVARNEARGAAEVEEREPSPRIEAPWESAPPQTATAQWQGAIARVDETPGITPPYPPASEPELPLVSRAPEQRVEAADREAAPRRPRKRAAAIWILAGTIVTSLVILLFFVVRPHGSPLTPKDRPTPPRETGLSVDVPAGSTAAMRVVEPADVTTAPAPESTGTKSAGIPGTKSPTDSRRPPAVGTVRNPSVPGPSPSKLSVEGNSGSGGRATGGARASGGGTKGDSKASPGGALATTPNSRIEPAATGPMWLMDGGDARRSGYAPARGPRKPRIAWSVEAGNRDQNSPLVGPDGRVYVWNVREHLLRSVENGRIVWSVPLPLNDHVDFGPDGSIQLSSISGRTRTLDRDGAIVRDVPSEIRYLGLFVWRGHAYFSNGITPKDSGSTRWFFFRADDRSWQVEVDDQATRPAIDENGVLYVGTNKGTLYAVSDAATILWSFMTGAGSTHGVAVTRDRDILAAVGQSLFSVRDGQLRWKFQGDGDGRSFPPIHDLTGTIYFGKGMDFYAVTAAGKELWRLRLGDPVSTAPAMDRSGRIYVATATRLYCIADADAP
jgi:outer membrane protein assembly factor BamB/tetratricopeptide (TPR) repeat protein